MRRTQPHTPIQYVMGKTEFCGLDFLVDERVLIPRPETEMLVETVVELLNDTLYAVRSTQYATPCPRILDLGTGSGCIAISLMVRLCSPSILSKASRGGRVDPFDKSSGSDPERSRRVEGLTKKLTDCKMVASDLSAEALAVAVRNAEKHGVAGRIEFIKSDVFDDVRGVFDIIVSNPPYVSRTEFSDLQKEVLKEPMMAFDGGQDGLDFYRRIVKGASRHMKEGGFIVMEMGAGQRKGIVELFEKVKGFKVVSEKKDYNEIERVIVAQWINS